MTPVMLPVQQTIDSCQIVISTHSSKPEDSVSKDRTDSERLHVSSNQQVDHILKTSKLIP